ncbi:ribbon-helix-helix protein, CopG family [Polymorphospora sp. NPDC050346]|uniref:ribbon-helix-helix protein, CopG family n=1 Tax=Polymorphospora sp. NPDC050346 TaxID=3155780 RepID=UPI0033E86370
MSDGNNEVVRAAAAFAAGQVEYDDTAQVELPPTPDTEPMVVRALRMPPELDRRVEQAAQAAGVTQSALIREFIELGLTELAQDATVSVAAIRRAVAHAIQSDRHQADRPAA